MYSRLRRDSDPAICLLIRIRTGNVARFAGMTPGILKGYRHFGKKVK
jgi:hypothetical protein